MVAALGKLRRRPSLPEQLAVQRAGGGQHRTWHELVRNSNGSRLVRMLALAPSGMLGVGQKANWRPR